MNKDQLVGNLRIALGRLNEHLASFSNSQVRHSYALQLQAAGRVQRTEGNARQIIKRSLRHAKVRCDGDAVKQQISI